jgi:signal transduction histidine kinase
LIQGTPREVWVLYTAGLGLAAWLATGLARQRQQADRTVREADEARRALERLMAIVAHDLRNPLAALVGHVQLLRRQLERPSPEALQRALVAVERIRGVADGMQGLTDDLLVTGSVAAGHLRIQPRPTDLAAIARDVVELEQAATEAHHLALEAPDSLVGEWDADRLAQVLVNLVSNAIKHSSGGHVRVVLRRAADNALLTVSDRGPGIPAGEVDCLFKAYARLDRDRATEGAGLGLDIVASIVEAHGGRVWVESGWGHGSTFCVVLPLRQARDGLGR